MMALYATYPLRRLLQRRRMLLLSFFLVLLWSPSAVVESHESCCKAKLAHLSSSNLKFIDDPTDNDTPPPEFDANGQPRFIVSDKEVMPEDWDEEDDGEWAPGMMENPNYNWIRRQIPNPQYVEPPGFATKATTEIHAALPWVTLGILITGVLSALMSSLFPELEASMFSLLQTSSSPSSSSLSSSGTTTSLVSLLWAALAGLSVPLCSCGALPLCAGLLQKRRHRGGGTSAKAAKGAGGGGRGVPLAVVVAFLTASQSAGLDSAAVTYGLLGPAAMLGRLAGAMILAVAAGWACTTTTTSWTSNVTTTTVTTSNSGETKRHDDGGSKTGLEDDHSMCQATTAPSVSSIVSICCETALEIYPTVLTGLVLSTAALHYLPSLTNYSNAAGEHDDSDVAAMAASSRSLVLTTRIAILSSALPLQLCEHTSVVLSSAIQKAGGSPGLAVAFLLSAPATNLPSLLFVWGASGLRTVVQLVGALIVTAAALSYVVDAAQLDLLAGEEAGEMATLPAWFTGSTSNLLAGLLLVGGLVQKLTNLNQEQDGADCCATPHDKKSNGKIKVA